jgi:hypothetical protein
VPPDVFRVDAVDDQWYLRHDGSTLGAFVAKRDAVTLGQQLARADPPSELVVYRTDGTIEFAYLYEHEPNGTGDPVPAQVSPAESDSSSFGSRPAGPDSRQVRPVSGVGPSDPASDPRAGRNRDG